MAEEKGAATQQQSKKRGKKVNKLTLKEIDKKLEAIKNNTGDIGGHSSRYAQHLLQRKKALTSK